MEILLLDPRKHLTSSCWTDFGRYIRSFPGWRTVRTMSTEADKKKYRQKKKTPSYFVYVQFGGLKTPQTPVKQSTVRTKASVRAVPIIPVKSKPTHVKPEPTPVKPKPAPVKPNPTSVKPKVKTPAKSTTVKTTTITTTVQIVAPKKR